MNDRRGHRSVLSARAWPLLFCLSCVPDAATAERIFADNFEPPIATFHCPSAPYLSDEVSGAIDPPGDMDYYRLTAVAGEWVELDITANPDFAEDRLDSVLTLYSGNGALGLARNDDDLLPPGGRDSRLVWRAPVSGDYCVKVEDYSTFVGRKAAGGPEYTYQLQQLPVDFASDFNNPDSEPNDSAATAQLVSTITDVPESGSQLTRILGTFASSSDIDVFRLDTGAQTLTMTVRFTPTGAGGYGGTVGLGLVDIVAANGSTVVGRLDPALGSRRLSLPAAPATAYHLYFHGPAGAVLGDNPFYVVEWETSPTRNQQETNNVSNDASSGAEVAAPSNLPDDTAYFIGGTLSGRGDTDWWSFQASQGDSISLFCGSRREGSGVLDPTVSLFHSPSAAPLQAETESASVDLAWTPDNGASLPPVPVSATGTHYLRIHATQFSGVVTDRHYNCAIHVRPPM